MISDNASTTEQAEIIATLIVDTKVAEGGIQAMVVLDEEYREAVAEQMKKVAVAVQGKA